MSQLDPDETVHRHSNRHRLAPLSWEADGVWYDTPMRWLGFNKNHHYRVGHAALVLAEYESGRCRYFDFGRYHAPYQTGRVRDAVTDAPLELHGRAMFEGESILNFSEILQEVNRNPCIGAEGDLYAAYCPVNVGFSTSMAEAMQRRGAVPFGPFVMGGSNCCRFVRTSIMAGAPGLKYFNRLRFLWLFSPTPMGIVHFLSHKTRLPACRPKHLLSMALYNKHNVNGTLPEPPRPAHLPPQCQWLAGEVTGSWFGMERGEEGFIIKRYSPEGSVECAGVFGQDESGGFEWDKPYRFAHLSHCGRVTVVQGGQTFHLHKMIARVFK